MINFPTSLDSLTNPTGTDYLNSPDHALQHSNENDAIEALEAKVGVDSSAVTSSIDYKLSHIRTLLNKTTEETKNNDAVTANDSMLTFSVAANTKYRFDMELFFTTTTAADFKYQFTGPVSPTYVAIRRDHVAAGTQTIVDFVDAAYLSTDVPVTGANGTGFIKMTGIIHNGANAGTVAFRWAQNTATVVDTVVKAGAYLLYCIT